MNKTAKKVLVVEDSRSVNEQLVLSIGSQLYIDVEAAYSLEEAKQILDTQSDKFFVAVLDLNLPDAPNGEIVDFVLDIGIPPIILTGNISDDLHDTMMNKPIIDYVLKRNLNEIEYVVEIIRRLRDNRGRKVLVVDDSNSARELMVSLLRRYNLEVFEASNGHDALKILDDNDDIILIITDYNMPKMDGMQLTAKVRKKFSRNELAIIGISTTGSGTISLNLLKSGANDFLPRPFIHEEFYCRVNQNIDAVVSYRILTDAADRDFLTGLFNRKYIFKTGEKLFQNAKRSNFTLTVAMIDIDYFKMINDTYGHQVGDMVLNNVASIFFEQLRAADVIARIGGDEFCLLCVNIDKDSDAELLFERLRKMITDYPLEIKDQTVSVTVSIGYTTVLRDTLDHMIRDADTALYEAKEKGRNKVVRFME